MKIIQIYDENEKERIAGAILSQLFPWFGRPESTEEYICESKTKPFWAAFSEENPVGFIVKNRTAPKCSEIFVMGVLPDKHRQGVGRALMETMEQAARENGERYIQVKTLKMGEDRNYDRTNLFYQAMGFDEMECFLELWDEETPCQIYIKCIDK